MSGKGAVASLIPELFRTRIYKPNQGRLVRQATFVGLVLIVGFGCFSLSNGLLGVYAQPIRVGVPIGIGVALAWVAYRVVNLPRFVDFLVSVESEREKVVWPGKAQVMRSTVVVIATMVFLGSFLFVVDMLWRGLFRLIHFIEYTSG